VPLHNAHIETMTEKLNNTWQNRIIGHGEESPHQLLANPKNWRIHPDYQKDALAGVLRQVGWVQEVIINKRTGFVVDGHLRIALAIKDKQPTVPVKYVDLTPEEEALILASLDPIANLADMNSTALGALLAEIQTDEPGLQALFDDMAQEIETEKEEALSDNAFDDVPDELDSAFTLKVNMKFPSNEIFGIPPLREDKLVTLPEKLEVWPGDDARELAGEGPYFLVWSSACRFLDFTQTIVSFYTDDYKFEGTWREPDKWAAKFLNANVLGVCTPNYSLWLDEPMAVHIWQIYRARWMGRYFQEAGLSVLPDVNWCSPEDYDFCFAGIPEGLPAIAIQVQTFNKKDTEQIKRKKDGIREAVRRLKPERLLVYAGKPGRELVEELDLKIPTIMLPTRTELRKTFMTGLNPLKVKGRGV